MKKITQYIPALIMLVFTALMIGIFIGRNTIHSTPKNSDEFSITSSESQIDSGKVNINSADENTLTMLPGIGPALAKRIVEYREANGDFLKITDLTNVKGIGDETVEKLKEYIITGG